MRHTYRLNIHIIMYIKMKMNRRDKLFIFFPGLNGLVGSNKVSPPHSVLPCVFFQQSFQLFDVKR